MMAVPWNYLLNVNLQEGAIMQLEFLQQVASQSELDDEKVLRLALNRYENYWLPLAAKHPGETLAAPLDVEWIWHCHILSPLEYQHDCNQVAGRIISHKLYGTMERRKHQQKTKSLWQVEYPQEPFHLDFQAAFCSTEDDLPSRLSYDVLAATYRQKQFFYQVSLPHFRDSQFLAASELRYKRFLFLKELNLNAQLVPSYDIDLMWHTHLLHPLAYKIDTETILGHTLVHDVFSDCSHNTVFNNLDTETVDLWLSTFDSEFAICGTLFRGYTSGNKLHAMTPQQNFMASTKTATFTIEKVDIQGLPPLQGKLILKLYAGLNGRIGKCIATFKGGSSWQGKDLPVSAFETDIVNYLKLRAIDQTGVLGCFGTREVVGEKDIDLRPTLDSLTHETSIEHAVSLSRVHRNPVVHMTTHFCWPQRGPVHLYLRVGIFTPMTLPESPESLWGPVPVFQHSVDEERVCYVASHGLVNHSESVVMTCRIIHSQSLLQSAVHVLYQDKMVAVAHLVGLEQLPLPTQVSDPRRVPYLNPAAGERALLIKHHAGDWAVVVGRWSTLRKTGSILGSRRGKDGHPGHLMVRVRQLDNYGWREFQLSYQEQQWRFTLDDLHVDLKSGVIRINNPDSEQIAEKVALAFSVAVLHVLCVPRPSGWKRGQSLRPAGSKRRSTRSSKWIPSEEMPFVLAAGVLQETPSNAFIRRMHGKNLCSYACNAFLGKSFAGIQLCKPEDGLGGAWAHKGDNLIEACAEGSDAHSDGGDSCRVTISDASDMVNGSSVRSGGCGEGETTLKIRNDSTGGSSGRSVSSFSSVASGLLSPKR